MKFLRAMYSPMAISLRVAIGAMIGGYAFVRALDTGDILDLVWAIFWATYTFVWMGTLLHR